MLTQGPPSDATPGQGSAAFATTDWSRVICARDNDSQDGLEALDQLCRDYWYPLYAFLRHQGLGPHDAEDCTQSFFQDLLRRESLRAVAPEKGRFRSFLLVALKRHVANLQERSSAQKRGGGAVHVPFDTALAERRYQAEPAGISADAMFERRWAMELLDRVLVQMRHEAATRSKTEHFELLKTFLTREPGPGGYAEVGTQLGVSEGAARVAVHRLRRRFRDLFRHAVTQTLAASETVEDEIRHLLSALYH